MSKMTSPFFLDNIINTEGVTKLYLSKGRDPIAYGTKTTPGATITNTYSNSIKGTRIDKLVELVNQARNSIRGSESEIFMAKRVMNALGDPEPANQILEFSDDYVKAIKNLVGSSGNSSQWKSVNEIFKYFSDTSITLNPTEGDFFLYSRYVGEGRSSKLYSANSQLAELLNYSHGEFRNTKFGDGDGVTEVLKAHGINPDGLFYNYESPNGYSPFKEHEAFVGTDKNPKGSPGKRIRIDGFTMPNTFRLTSQGFELSNLLMKSLTITPILPFVRKNGVINPSAYKLTISFESATIFTPSNLRKLFNIKSSQ